MTKSSDRSEKSPADGRKARLARALRDNLKRRKEQARERGAADSPDAEGRPAERPGQHRRA